MGSLRRSGGYESEAVQISFGRLQPRLGSSGHDGAKDSRGVDDPSITSFGTPKICQEVAQWRVDAASLSAARKHEDRHDEAIPHRSSDDVSAYRVPQKVCRRGSAPSLLISS